MISRVIQYLVIQISDKYILLIFGRE